ncbi:hypothetical protein ACRC7T_19015, partial [Segnochrobactraceae bacterium EtOH-i3]
GSFGILVQISHAIGAYGKYADLQAHGALSTSCAWYNSRTGAGLRRAERVGGFAEAQILYDRACLHERCERASGTQPTGGSPLTKVCRGRTPTNL